MADDINSLTIVGRLTKNAELKYTNSGSPVTKFTLAVNRTRKDGNEWVSEASFFEVSLWGKRGEKLNQYLTKGSRVAVTGELRQDRWEQDGLTKSKVFIHANSIQLLGDKHNNSSGNHFNNYPPRYQKQGDYSPKNDPRHSGINI